MAKTQKPYLGLALSGGTLKAAAHIGVLTALEKLGIHPDVIAGTSAGSLVSTLYAHGYQEEQFQGLFDAFPGLRLVDYGFPFWSSALSLAAGRIIYRRTHIPYVPTGLLRSKKLVQYVERLLANRRPQIPYYVVATDLVTGRPIVFSSQPTDREDSFVTLEDVPRAVAGSCALPGIFTPVVLNDYILVDGAMRHYIPATILKEVGCQKIIAVNLYRLPTHYTPLTLVDVLARSFDILLRESIDNDIILEPTTYVLEPDLSHMKWRRFAQLHDCAQIGYDLVMSQQAKIKDFVRN